MIPEVYRAMGEVWDRNTIFFYAQTIIKHKQSRIFGLFVGDVWCIDDEVLQREAMSFYRYLFSIQEPCHPNRLVL